MTKEEKQKCLFCDNVAVVTMSPDLDVRGLSACESHRIDLRTAYEILIFLGEDEFDEFLKKCRKSPAK